MPPVALDQLEADRIAAAARNVDGFCGPPRTSTSKRTCGPVERPVVPTSPTCGQRQEQLRAARVNGAAFREPRLPDNAMHRHPLMPTPSLPRRSHPVTLQQAAEDSPTLARLAQLARESGAQLKAVESLIPLSLRPAVRPGPIDGGSWCLLVDGNAAAAKLRQVLPALLSRLRDRGSQITSIRLKVQTAGK